MPDPRAGVQKRGRGRPRRDEGPDSRQILNAALAAFARFGWEGTNLRQIAEAAQVDTALIVRRFDGKMGLWRAVVDNVADALGQISQPFESLPVADRLRHAIERFVRFNLERPDLGRFFVDEIAQPGLRRNYVIERIWTATVAQLLPILQEAEQAGLLRNGTDAQRFLAMMVGAVAMPLMMRSVAVPDVDSDTGQAAFLRNVLALLGPQEPRRDASSLLRP